MIFEARNGKTFKGWPISKYRYNLEVNESCYAIRMVLDNGEEYIVGHESDEVKCKKRCANFNKTFETKVHYIKVTRTSDEDYSYNVISATPNRNRPGTTDGKFVQEVKDQFDEFTINPSYYRPTNIEKTKEKDTSNLSLSELYSKHISNI